jgi:hypothetical protein
LTWNGRAARAKTPRACSSPSIWAPTFAANDLKLVLRALCGPTGMLRAQIARAIPRKRVPELVFQVLGDAPDLPN